MSAGRHTLRASTLTSGSGAIDMADFKADEYQTADWKLEACRKFFQSLLGFEVGHFVLAFSNHSGEKGVIATSPDAIWSLDPAEIYREAGRLMAENGRKIIRKEVDVGRIIKDSL
jgi:hypothetical protein